MSGTACMLQEQGNTLPVLSWLKTKQSRIAQHQAPVQAQASELSVNPRLMLLSNMRLGSSEPEPTDKQPASQSQPASVLHLHLVSDHSL